MNSFNTWYEDGKPLSPCLNCPDRKMRCHSTCERYKKFCEANEAYKAKKYKSNVAKDWSIAKVRNRNAKLYKEKTRNKKHR